jgi:hypothetical protein
MKSSPWPVRHDNGKLYDNCLHRTKPRFDYDCIRYINVPRSVERGSGMCVRDQTPNFCLVLHATKQRDTERHLLLANQPSFDLWTTALASLASLSTSTKYGCFLERELESTEDNWMH